MDITTVLDMIPQGPRFPAVPILAILKVLPAISPRLYSITHCPATSPLTATMLCRLQRYRDGRDCVVDGLCSSYLTERIKVGAQAAIFFRQSTFHLPVKSMDPVIMICGGTGIAPFLSFLAERARLVSLGECVGPAVLYFGCRTSSEYMFRAELLERLKVSS